MTSPEQESPERSEASLTPTNPAFANVGVGSVFVRKSVLMPESLQKMKRLPFSTWFWHIGVGEPEFQTALKDAGWKWFFLGKVLTVRVFGEPGADTMHKLLEKALLRVHEHHPNSFTVTAVSSRNRLGFKSVSLSVQARHAQRGIPANTRALNDTR